MQIIINEIKMSKNLVEINCVGGKKLMNTFGRTLAKSIKNMTKVSIKQMH